MAAGNENITVWEVTRRLFGKLKQKDIRQAMLTANRLDRETVMSIGLVLERHAAERPDVLALKYADRTWTWRQFNAWANRYASYFAARQVGHGDTIAINLENRPECVVAVCAANKLGAVAAMINTTQRADALRHSFSLVKPKLVIVGEEQLDAMSTIPDDIGQFSGRLLYLADGSDEPAPEGYIDLEMVSMDLDDTNPSSTMNVRLKDPCFHIFTSGTTGLPKASVMTHYRWYRAALVVGKVCLEMNDQDVMYNCLPLYHNAGLIIGMGASFGSGGAFAISRKFSASRFWDEVIALGATRFSYIGELLRYLLNQPPSEKDRAHRVRGIMGNGLRPDVWDEFKERFAIERINEFYGASEGPSGFMNLFNFDKTCGWAPDGYAIVEYDVDADEPVIDGKGRMQKVKKGGTGLLLLEVSDKNPYDGYTDSAASEKKLFRDVFRRGDVWFNSGDLIRYQGAGHVQFIDRIGDTFRWQGENVATTEVEAVINHFPQTEDAVVYGVQVPGCDGRCGMVSFTPKNGAPMNWAALAAHLRKGLPRYAVPRFLRINTAQDITGTFKHQKAKLKKEGFDLAQVDGEVYYLPPKAETWMPLTPQAQAAIEAGEITL